MNEWVISLTYDLDPSMAEMDRWEDQLAGHDGFVSRPRNGVIDVTVHTSTALDICDASRKLSDVVDQVVGARPSGLEVITEAELFRRADEPTMPELMSAAEVAHELGVSRQRVHKLRSMRGFPAPLVKLGGGAVWDAVAVRKFAEQWERKPGRPRVGERASSGQGSRHR